MSHSNVKTVVGRNKSEKFYNIIKIIKRFTHSHKNNVRNSYVKVTLCGLNLSEHFRRRGNKIIQTA